MNIPCTWHFDLVSAHIYSTMHTTQRILFQYQLGFSRNCLWNTHSLNFLTLALSNQLMLSDSMRSCEYITAVHVRTTSGGSSPGTLLHSVSLAKKQITLGVWSSKIWVYWNKRVKHLTSKKFENGHWKEILLKLQRYVLTVDKLI